jgi:ferredoxin/flavodoxin---NADP+ reductase
MSFRTTHGPAVITFKKERTLSLPPMVYDVIIIGGGPAGLTAGVYARTRALSTLILEAQAMGGQLEWLYPTKSVYDYPSYIAIEGRELAELFGLHSRESGAELRPEEVVDIQRRAAAGFAVRTRQGNLYEGRAIVLGMGMGLFEPKRLGVPGETELEAKGVEYRVRDRRDFKGKRVIVVGGGDSALEIALEIVAGAKKVILVHRREEFRAMEKNVEAVLKSPVQVVYNAEVTSIEGDGKVERAVVYDNRTLKKKVFDVDAVIVNIGFEPKMSPLRKWGIELEGERLIRVKADMSTSVPGIYACGDIVSYPGKDKRIVTGCGEAVTAIMSVYKYLKQPYWA